MKTIHKTWFKNRLRKGLFLYKCTGKYTDDYAHDAAYNFFTDNHFKEAPTDLFNDWYISCCHIYGDKNGIISLSFASCEYYEFTLK